MLRRVLYVLMIGIFFSSCKKDIVYKFDYSTMGIDAVAACAVEPCPEVDISLVKVQQPQSISKNVHGLFEETVIQILEEEGQDSSTIPQAVANYVNNIQTGYPEGDVLSGLNEVMITTEIAVASNTLLCIILEYYKYSGGAHGYGEIQYYNFNPQTGEVYPKAAYFKDESGFLNLAKAHFYTMFDITEGTSLSSRGFFFSEDIFHLPKQIGFTDTEVVLLYNPYEITSYADGPVELRIPINEALEFLNFF